MMNLSKRYGVEVSLPKRNVGIRLEKAGITEGALGFMTNSSFEMPDIGIRTRRFQCFSGSRPHRLAFSARAKAQAQSVL